MCHCCTSPGALKGIAYECTEAAFVGKRADKMFCRGCLWCQGRGCCINQHVKMPALFWPSKLFCFFLLRKRISNKSLMFACHFMLSTVSHFELLGNTFCPKPRVFRNTNYSYYKTGFTEPQELFCFCQNQLCIFSKLWLLT